MEMSRILDHVGRASLQFGRRFRIGAESYRLKGYYASNFALNRDGHEPDVNEAISRHLASRSGAFLDVGVNIGQTLYNVLSIDPRREYYGFEPLVGCCDDIVRFAALNGLRNVHLLPIGLGNENRIATFYARDMQDSMASLIPQENAATSFVPLRKGDEVVRELGIEQVAMIKVDVEGAEWQVFDGLRETLMRDRPALIFEALPNFDIRGPLSPEAAAGNRERTAKLQSVLFDCGYRINRIERDGSETSIAELNPDGPWFGNNFTAVPA
jgi:FkbM family methyltransferase